MSGYIGERAKNRRRKFIFFFIFILIVLFFYYLFPLLKLSELKPSDSLLPNESEILTPQINTTIEELQLNVFDREQKIIFRNKQIDELKGKINILSIENENLIESLKNLKDELNLNKNGLIKKIKNDESNEIKKLNIRNNELNIKNKELNISIEKYKDENNATNKELKKIFNKNLKLKELSDKKINELEDLIEEKNLIIQLLKDNNPHN